ncbi:MAG: carboxymuconolactone decarboxylase family protein [Burkholderiales bacterium]
MAENSAPRLPYVPEQPQDPRVGEVFARLRKQWQGAPVLNLYRLLGWAPGLVGPWLEFGRALRFQVSASAKLRELLVVRSGQLLDAEYEWKHHWVAAKDAGVTDEKLHALSDWKASALFDAEERAVLALADETAQGRGASEETLRVLKSLFPNEQVVELVIVAGFYAGVARIVNSLSVPIESGFESMVPRQD